MTEEKETILGILERGVQLIATDKFANVLVDSEPDLALRATVISCVGRALGETLGKAEYPTHWQRFLQRKDCPAYMKELTQISVDAYYPKLSLPQEENWVTINK